MDKDQKIDNLRDKLEAGYQTFTDDMVSRGAQIVFENADLIHYNQQVYEKLFDGNFLSDDLLNRLLESDDPLQVARTQWAFWSESILQDELDISKELSEALKVHFEYADGQSDYGVNHLESSETPDQCQKM